MNFKEKLNPTTKVNVIQSLVPKIAISREAITKMFIYVKECSDEIGWLGTVKQIGEERFYLIEDVFLFEQDVHGTTTEITPEGLSRFAEEVLQNPDGLETWNSIKMWGHSHVNMGITPSGQDDKQMDEFKSIGHEYFIRLICNKKGEMKIDFFDYVTGVIYLDVPWAIMPDERENALKEEIAKLEEQINALKEQTHKTHESTIKEEMKQKVRKITYKQNYPSNYWSTRYKNEKKDPRVPEDATFWNDYGYTDKNGKWNRFVDIKEPVKKNKTSGTNVGRNANLEFFESDDDVLDAFSLQELADMAEAETLEEVEEQLEILGWFSVFSEDDVERIYRVALKTFSGYDENYFDSYYDYD